MTISPWVVLMTATSLTLVFTVFFSSGFGSGFFSSFFSFWAQAIPVPRIKLYKLTKIFVFIRDDKCHEAEAMSRAECGDDVDRGAEELCCLSWESTYSKRER